MSTGTEFFNLMDDCKKATWEARSNLKFLLEQFSGRLRDEAEAITDPSRPVPVGTPYDADFADIKEWLTVLRERIKMENLLRAKLQKTMGDFLNPNK